MKFWDASALLPLCIDERQSGGIRTIAKKDGSLAVWWGSLVECSSAFARLRREEALSPLEDEQVRVLLEALSASWTEIEPSDHIRDTAQRLLRIHPLRAADALQLAAAIIWADKSPKGHQFVCLDEKLREAAKKEGFILLP